MNKTRLLIVEDDETLSQLLAAHLSNRGYDVTLASRGREGLQLATAARPDLVILDIMMPDMDGWTVAARLREVSDVPIIMLTALSDRDEVVRGLRAGADDYVTKPFDAEELDLRIQAVLRRVASAAAQDDVYDDGVLAVDLPRRLVLRRGKAVHLTPTEFGVLAHLVRNRGRVVGHDELIASAWGDTYAADSAVLAVYIRHLREKLEEDPSAPVYVQTEWGTGYLFVPRTEGQEP
jgi:two-component system KDP operon response regulator KdpE